MGNDVKLLLLVIAGLFWPAPPSVAEDSGGASPTFVSSDACAGCHRGQFDAWSRSHHSWAWREPTTANVLADFDDARFEHRGFTYQFTRRDGRFLIVADGPDGKATTYPVRYVVGVTPLQQYLVETDRGRLQALDVAWDTKRRRWYHLYPTTDTSAGDGMHWSGSYKNWNARCAECHATGFKKNYDPLGDMYRSTQAEIGVGCEACHGPGQAHVAWANEPQAFDSDGWNGVDGLGLRATYRKGEARTETNLCAACHSRREPLGADSPPPGAEFDDHYRLALLRDGLYFPDGQIRDEVYVYGSFLQSKMHAAGVTCTDCHDAHSYGLRRDGNSVCTQCHSPRGNPAFPTLRARDYDSPRHHFHPRDGESGACVSCHMPERDYMVVDGRRDHGFRVPRPDLSAALGTPDTCTGCHGDRTSQWAMEQIRRWHPEARSGSPHFAHSFAKAVKGADDAVADALREIASTAAQPAIVRATALHRLSAPGFPVGSDDLAGWVQDPSPLVRAEAARLLLELPETARIAWLTALLGDRSRSVRIEAAKASLGMDPGRFAETTRPRLSAAMSELQAALRAKADFPETQMAIGGVALTLRNLPAASQAFRRAVTMDPQLVQAWLMLARIQAARGDRDEVQATLEQAIRSNPAEPLLRQALSGLPARE